jgi:predicted acylesterase/phospholipase RssA
MAMESAPTQWCDVVMKGGITSGVVYPAAVGELAGKYRFRSIGGTSAGAIAAALTAAAELGRGVPGSGFDRLARLPDELARDLLSLFQPAACTRTAFAVLLAFLGADPWWRKGARALGAALRGHWPVALAGLVVGWGADRLLVAALHAHPGPIAGWLLGGLVAAASALVFLVLGFLWTAYRGLSENRYGLCSGMPPGKGRQGCPPLTPWLADLIDATAGGRKAGTPLTFGDLWGLPPGASDAEKDRPRRDPNLRQVNLEVMTTNLTHGRPYRIPFFGDQFFYREQEFRDLFPPRVVDWMVAHSPLANLAGGDPDLRQLPHPADLPVVVAARLSLSFPLLLSAVPLYAVDFRRPRNQAAKQAQGILLYERCWFSDGGIGSNFPIHFFDGMLPGRPTFGVNLRPFLLNDDGTAVEVAPDDPCASIDFPRVPQGEVAPEWNRFDGLLAFPAAIVRTMQNWVDSTQMHLPGYRDRVVHIRLTGREGGMNLNMPPARVKALSERGRCAGQALCQRFDWDRHRWTRFRTSLLQLQRSLASMQAVYQDQPGQGESFAAFLARYAAAPANYPLKDPAQAEPALAALLDVAAAWTKQELDLESSFPRPEPLLRIMPRV